MFHVCQAERGQVLEHLIFQLVAVDHQEDGRLLRLGCLEEHLGRLDHRVGLAAALRVPDEPAGALRVEGAADDPSTAAVWCCRRMNFCSSSSFSAKRMKSLQEAQHVRHGAEGS